MFTDAGSAMRYMKSGKAIFTIESKRTGKHFTYRLNFKKEGDERSPIFVSVLTGQDNNNNYSYFGFIKNSGELTMRQEKAKIALDSISVNAFKWAYERLSAGILPDDLVIRHNGRCGRCQRLLTVPESIDTGLGPECAKKA